MAIPFSSNELFTEISDKDTNAEIIGYIDEVTAPYDVGTNKKWKLMKFIVSNGTGKKIQCLIWGNDLISKYKDDISVCKIIHIERGYTKATKSSYSAQELVPFELIIQNHTNIEFLGMHNTEVPEEPHEIQDVNFETIKDEDTGSLIRIRGFIRTTFEAVPCRFGNSTYGSGAITDLSHKITVNVTNYSPLNFQKGHHVCVTGTVKDTDAPIIIMCKDSSGVILDNSVEDVSAMDVLQGIRTPKRRIRES